MIIRRLKRPCYFNHRLGKERHVWRKLRKHLDGHRCECVRCGYTKTTASISAIFSYTLRRRYRRISDNVTANNYILAAMRRAA